jgi:terminase large subunit-like protein
VKRDRAKWVNPVPSWSEASAHQRVLLDAAWRAGELDFLLTPTQAETYRKIRRWQSKPFSDGRHFGLDSSRRWGKSALLTTIGLEDGYRHPGWRIVYIAPTYRQVKAIVRDLFAGLTRSCPPALRPKYMRSDSVYEFGNGSRIELVGLDTNPDAARGSAVDLVLLDEAGFFDDLEYILVSVIGPQTLGRDHARIIAASTPPITPAHHWSKEFVPMVRNRGAHDKRTLDDADQYSPEEIEAQWEDIGGRDSIAGRREYGAEHIADESLAIVPEFRTAEEHCVIDLKPPTWRDCYVSLDPGFHDLSAALFGYWDFSEGRLVIEDEFAAPRLNSRDLAMEIKKKEERLWKGVRRRGNSGSFDTKPQPYLRVCDNDLRLIADLHKDHGLTFIPTQKDNLENAVNQVRIAIQTGKIIIHPRCKKLIDHLRHGVWKKVNRLFDRDDAKGMGHYDTIAALVYLWRNVQKRRNPVPDLERYVMPGVPANDNRTRAPSKWADNDAKMRRVGQRYFVRGGKKIA